MNRITRSVAGIAFVGVIATALPARADTLLAPWLGVAAGGASASGTIGFGATVESTASGVIGLGFDIGYARDFFGTPFDSSVLTSMANVVVSIPFDRTTGAGIRPFATGGIGLIRSRIDGPIVNRPIVDTDAGVNVGGGVNLFLGAHAGVRAELRYIRSLDTDIGRLEFWRTTFAFVLR